MAQPSLRVLSPEVRLLLATTGDRADPSRVNDALEAGVDWDRLYALSVRERACPVLWRQLAPLVRDAIPEAAATQLQRLAGVAEFRMTMLEERLHRSLDALEAAGLEVLVVKGAALAPDVYPSFMDRPMMDIDFLVDEHSAERAQEVLRENGWSWDQELFPADTYGGHHHLPPLHDAMGTEMMVEVHRGLLIPGHPFALELRELWESARSIELEGREILVPEPVRHLIYLCLHFAWSHRLTVGPWRMFRDVLYLSESPDFSWDRFVYTAHATRAGSCCYWTLRLANRLAAVPVPSGVLDRLRPKTSRRVARLLERHYALRMFSTEPPCPSIRLERMMWLMGIRPKASGHGPDAIRPWARETFNPIELPHAGRREKLSYHLRTLASWKPYLGRLLGSGA